jgi:hypothetical protein
MIYNLFFKSNLQLIVLTKIKLQIILEQFETHIFQMLNTKPKVTSCFEAGWRTNYNYWPIIILMGIVKALFVSNKGKEVTSCFAYKGEISIEKKYNNLRIPL